MTDLLDRLRTVNPVPTCTPPTIHDVLNRLDHDGQTAPRADLRDASGHKRLPGRARGLSRASFWFRHAGMGLAVAVPVLVAGLAIVLLGHNHDRAGQTLGVQTTAPARSKPVKRRARSRVMSIDAALGRGIRPLAPDANASLPILGSSRSRSLKSFRGQVVVLNVFASWCEPCKAQASALERVQTHIAGQGATVLGVTYRDSRAASEGFVRARHINYPVLRDPTGRFVQSFDITGVPETFVIDRFGQIAAAQRYLTGETWLEQTLARVIASSSSAGQISETGIRAKASPTASAIATMANTYPVLGHRQQPTDIPPYGVLNSRYVRTQGGLVANSRRALTTPHGEALYLVPAHQSICVVSSDSVVGGCGQFPTTPDHAVTIGTTICAPNLPPNEIEVVALLPAGASHEQAHYSNGPSQPTPTTNGLIAIYARRKGPLPRAITWTDHGQQHASTGVPPNTATAKCGP